MVHRNRVMGILDLDGFFVAKCFVPREVEFCEINSEVQKSLRFNLLLQRYSKASRQEKSTVRKVVNNVYGLPFFLLQMEETAFS